MEFQHFPPIFVLIKMTCLVTLFDRKLQVFENSPKWTIFGIFNQLLSTQNVNVARFARKMLMDCWTKNGFLAVCVSLQFHSLARILMLISLETNGHRQQHQQNDWVPTVSFMRITLLSKVNLGLSKKTEGTSRLLVFRDFFMVSPPGSQEEFGTNNAALLSRDGRPHWHKRQVELCQKCLLLKICIRAQSKCYY